MNKNREQGFVLMSSILVFIITASIILPYVAKYFSGGRFEERKAVIDEIHILGIAAQNYYSEFAIFPDSANSCFNAITAMTNATNSFIAGVDTISPWGTSYNFSCTNNLFNISVELNNDNAAIVANSLAGATATGAIITATVPIPSYMPALASFLSLNIASNSFNARNKKIVNVDDIELTGVSDTLKSIINSQAKFYTVEHNDRVYKPNPPCIAPTSPTIHLSLVGLVAINQKIPYANPPYIKVNNASYWTIGIDVYTEDGAATAGVGTYALAIVNCV